MMRLLRPLAVASVAALALASPGTAGPDKIQYPANWKDHVQYLMVDRYDPATGLTAMSRTTALTTSVTAQVAAAGGIHGTGVLPLERVGADQATYDAIHDGLARRGVVLRDREV